jgi:hypothetical protein
MVCQEDTSLSRKKMNLNLTRAKQYLLPVVPAMLVTLVLQCLPAAVLAVEDDPELTASTTQVTDSATTEGGFDAEQLEQLVAPIALYPDALLMQILMASTYPLEIVEADRWISGQPDLKGDALDEALLDQDWDPSVKSLTTLPSVLSQMSENLDWTQDLGDAFLAQESEVLDTAQRMRGLAYEAGNLETTEQQTVTQQEDKIIVIESSSPEVIYVPTYSPTVVYGVGWGYPYWFYPRWYYPPRPGYGFVAFGAGVAVGAAIWGGCRWGWGRSSVNININRHNTFNRNTNRNFDRNRANAGKGATANWKHDSSHRKGVNYRNSDVAKKHGASSGSNRVTRDQARGHSSATTANRASGMQSRDRGVASPKAGLSNKTGVSNTDRARSSNAGSRSPSVSDRSRTSSPSTANRQRSSSNSAYSGSRSPSVDRRSSSRGASSRGTRSYGGSRGGASRGGGRRR